MSDRAWPIDMSVLAETAGPRAAAMLPNLIPIYLEDGDLLMRWLTEAMQRGEATKMQQAAHRLKGNSASLGVLSVARLAQELETLGNAGELTTAVQPFTALVEEYDKVKLALLDMVSQVE
ncbi:MAG: Hpt domain-containing protein [Ardenticatenaceae bacterium]|nr:Hpt domain-containing protein [Ardenticatenaceae bacterium]